MSDSIKTNMTDRENNLFSNCIPVLNEESLQFFNEDV